MVLPHHHVFLVLQPNLEFLDTQEDLISELNLVAWQLKRNNQQYHQVMRVFEEEERGEILRGVLVVQELVVVNQITQVPARNLVENSIVKLAERRYTKIEKDRGLVDEYFEALKGLNFSLTIL